MRSRSVAIYAQTEEEFHALLDEVELKSSSPRKKMIKPRITEENDSDDDLSGLSFQENKVPLITPVFVCDDNIEEPSAEEAEEKLLEQLDKINQCYRQGDQISLSNYEDAIGLLSTLLKESISIESDRLEGGLFYPQSKKINRARSGNAIYDISIRELVDSIISENRINDIMMDPRSSLKSGTNTTSSASTNFSPHSQSNVRDMIIQNIEVEEKVKFLVMSNDSLLKKKILSTFLGEEEEADENFVSSSGLDIKKKNIQLFRKNISVEFLDTEKNFHLDNTSKIYYKIAQGFFFIIDLSKEDSLEYLRDMHTRIRQNTSTQAFIVIGVILSIDNTILELVKDYTEENEMIFFPIRGSDFEIGNPRVNNLFTLILIQTKIIPKKFNIINQLNTAVKDPVSSIGYKKNYQIKHITAFDYPDSSANQLHKRKWSEND